MKTTITASPAEVFANATLANFDNFFDLAFAGQDVTAVVAKQAAQVASMGGNASISDQLLNALESLLPILTNTPDTSQKALIAQKVADLLTLIKDLIASFPGIQNFETNPNLLTDPLNAAFYALYNQLKTDAQNLIADPALALAYFSDPAEQAKLAEIIATKLFLPGSTTENSTDATSTNFNNFFDLAFLKQDTIVVSLKQAAVVKSMGGNATITCNFLTH